MADKEPAPGTHETFIKPLWKQGVGSTIHCVAGDATGIITAAAVTALFGLPMWLDLIVEYIAGFLFGLLVFQSLFMKGMMGGTYLENVRRMFLPEMISMNCIMAGMAPVMSLLMMGRDMRAMQPTELAFWGVMSLGVVVGFSVAYPAGPGGRDGPTGARRQPAPWRSRRRRLDHAARHDHELTASVTRWTILPGIEVDAYAFNRQVPGPRLRVTEGERIRIRVRNELSEPTSVHWHGMILPNAMDGAAGITQPPIPPGGDYTYEFDARQPGTHFYHTHD